jgi:transcriptional regulator with XRE-family HTH domain
MSTSGLVKQIRKLRGWTQGQLASALGVKQATISRWETGLDEPSGPAMVVLKQMVLSDAVGSPVEAAE